jgi:D-psicose/D-tagatose/L-ribulose 3-epimerase
MCAFQTGSTYYTRGNCLSTADDSVRRRTIGLLKSFVDLASRWNAVIVFGSLQGRLSDEPDRQTGEVRIREAVREVGEYAADKHATLAFEPVNHSEVGFNNTIAEVAEVVRGLDLPRIRMMVDTYHMNIEEKDLLAPLAGIRDILAHVHLSETNRDVLGQGRWPTAAFCSALAGIGYEGYCSVGVYNTRCTRRECITRCVAQLAERGHQRT